MNYLVTGLICSGKSTFLDIAKKYSFDAIKSDDIVSSLYNDESVVFEIEKNLDIKPNQDNLQEIVKKLFFTSKKNREAKEKDKIIDAAIRKGQAELDEIKVRLDSLKSYDRSMYFYYQSYFNLAYQDDIPGAINMYRQFIKEEDAQEKLKEIQHFKL